MLNFLELYLYTLDDIGPGPLNPVEISLVSVLCENENDGKLVNLKGVEDYENKKCSDVSEENSCETENKKDDIENKYESEDEKDDIENKSESEDEKDDTNFNLNKSENEPTFDLTQPEETLKSFLNSCGLLNLLPRFQGTQRKIYYFSKYHRILVLRLLAASHILM